MFEVLQKHGGRGISYASDLGSSHQRDDIERQVAFLQVKTKQNKTVLALISLASGMIGRL